MIINKRYEPTIDLYENSACQYAVWYFFRHYLIFLIIVAVVSIKVGIDILLHTKLMWYRWIGWGSFIIPSVLALYVIKSFIVIRKRARESFHNSPRSSIIISIEDEGFLLQQEGNIKKIFWCDISKILKTKDFLVIIKGISPEFSLPRKVFNKEEIKYILSRIQKDKLHVGFRELCKIVLLKVLIAFVVIIVVGIILMIVCPMIISW